MHEVSAANVKLRLRQRMRIPCQRCDLALYHGLSDQRLWWHLLGSAQDCQEHRRRSA